MTTRFAVGLVAVALLAAPKDAVAPPGRAETPNESAAMVAGGYVYVSAQGPADANGRTPEGFAAQARQALENVDEVIEAAGLSRAHVVYTKVYVLDPSLAGTLDDVFAEHYGDDPPARAVVGVNGLPYGAVAIQAVAVADRTAMRPVSVEGYDLRGYSAGMLTADRLYLSSIPARPGPAETQVDRALDAFESIARAAGLDLRHLVFVNPYLTQAIEYRTLNEAYAKRFEHGNTPARATIFVAGLPSGPITFTGVAVRKLSDRQAVRPKNMPPSPTASPCVLAADTLFCSAKSGFIPGPNSGIYAPSVGTQLRQTMRNLLDGLEEAGMGFTDVASTNVYLDDLREHEEADAVYGEYFDEAPPARTTVQQTAPRPASREPDSRGRYGTLEQISLIAVRSR